MVAAAAVLGGRKEGTFFLDCKIHAGWLGIGFYSFSLLMPMGRGDEKEKGKRNLSLDGKSITLSGQR